MQISLKRLRETINQENGDPLDDDALLDLEDVLLTIRRMLHAYFVQLIEFERQALLHDNEHEAGSHDLDPETMESIPHSLQESVEVLLGLIEMRPTPPSNPKSSSSSLHELTRRHSFPKELLSGSSRLEIPRSSASPPPPPATLEQLAGDSSGSSAPFEYARSASNSLLFRLIVSLQLCLVRINDVSSVMGNVHRRGPSHQLMAVSAASLGTAAWALRPHFRDNRTATIDILSKVSITTISMGFLYRWWVRLWMLGNLAKSTAVLEEWREQWMQVVESVSSSPASSRDAKLRTEKLIEFAKNQNPQMSFWQSEGELRFLVLKRAMDLLYASVGTALEVTKPNRSSKVSWQTSLTAMAAASYLSVIGPNKRAAQAVSKSSSALIQNAWGMVSLPAIKLLSLRATRLLKGAAMAERVIIAGVPCFVLSKDPCPDVVISLKRFERQERRRSLVSRLSTIDERDIGNGRRRRQRSTSITLKRRHVIFHLTGGGFFAHTLASDLPYLLDWSKTTGAMVICPEYALLPEHTFPVALNQVCTVYSALMGGNASIKLGFDVNRIVVTGESAGGNLAAAMCVKLGMMRNSASSAGDSSGEEGHHQHYLESPSTFFASDPMRLPDALMLSCAALNLSLELSPSRVIGDQDPVLPSGLISAISDSYAGHGDNNKQDPLVSPLYASDDELRQFPPTLLFASSDDPLLDDSVHFNTRLRCLGVESDLRATHHMPHAYWGLGTAGFPEAQQVQVECQEFLQHQLQGDRDEHSD